MWGIFQEGNYLKTLKQTVDCRCSRHPEEVEAMCKEIDVRFAKIEEYEQEIVRIEEEGKKEREQFQAEAEAAAKAKEEAKAAEKAKEESE